MNQSVHPIVLSGGSGTRLWPLSREHYPKQLLALSGGGETMLQATLLRASGLDGLLAPIVVCNEGHRFLVAEQLRQLGADAPEIILEPAGRNTAPAIALAARAALARSSVHDAVLLVLPADHVIPDDAAFRRAVAAALPLAAAGRFVTFGIVPQGPETGYGYIVQGSALEGSMAYEIARFVEKPSRPAAEALMAAGGCYWNSGMFLFSAKRYLDALQQYAPDIGEVCGRSWAAAKIDTDFIRPDPTIFATCRSDSIDYAVMEKVAGAAVVPLDAGWSDVGSWSSLHEALERDGSGNALRGDVIAEDTTDTLVLSESRLVATVGLRGHVVVETKDAVLVAPKDRAQDVKAIVARLKAEGRSEHALHREVHRPWGSYDSIEQGPGYQVKRITVKPGASISLQLHHHRSEHWIVVAGRARITRGDEVFDLEPNQSTYIPVGTKHRMENLGTEPLQIIEVQSGSYLGEDDIVRFDDRYGREGTKG
jgi:mannose-1-phosphate guanylyltransferase/mannose-6-phosphate isomerase